MNTKQIMLGALILAILVVGWVFLGSKAPSIGGSTSDDWNVGGNLNITGTSAFTGVSTFTASPVFNSDVVITTSNTATSSITVGCIDTYATSTDTAVRLSATTTPGVAYWSYGTCSSL